MRTLLRAGLGARITGFGLGVLTALTGRSQAQEIGPVEAQMRQVDFRVDPTVTLRIGFLRGRLLPVRPAEAPWFDDKHSFALEIDSAQISLSAQSISDLLNRHVFAYRGAPLRSVTVSIVGARAGSSGHLELRGRLHGLPVHTTSIPELTENGELRLRTLKVRALGIGVTGLLGTIGLSLEKLVDWSKVRGIRAQGNDLVLSPTALLPAPRMTGRLAGILVRDSTLVQLFRPTAGSRVPALLDIPDTTAVNYMYFRGRTLRFGRLTMAPADLLIMDLDPADPLDFYLDGYRAQLAVGFSRNTTWGGLFTYLPDYPSGLAQSSKRGEQRTGNRSRSSLNRPRKKNESVSRM